MVVAASQIKVGRKQTTRFVCEKSVLLSFPRSRNTNHNTAHTNQPTNLSEPAKSTSLMSTSPSPTMRWALRLSLLAGGVAVVLSLQPHLLPRGVLSQPSTTTSSSSRGGQDEAAAVGVVVGQTYCYQGVRTAAITPPAGADGGDGDERNCFEVLNGGRFGRVFSSSSTSESDVPAYEGGNEREIRKGYVLPGLWDGHGHLLQYGEFLHSADLFGAGSPEEVRRRLRAYLAHHPGVGGRGEWVRGVGWDQMVMGGMPFAVSFLLIFWGVGRCCSGEGWVC